MKKNNDSLVGFFMLFVMINVLGFFSWVAYQLMAKQLMFLPSVSLLTGLSAWWLFIIMFVIPQLFLLGVKYQLDLMFELQKISSTNKILNTLKTIVPADSTKNDNWPSDFNDKFRH